MEAMRPMKRRGDVMLWAVFAASVAVALLTVIATRLNPPAAPPPGMGPVFPRMPAPPQWNLGELMRTMGIGSLTWYACVLSAPLFILMSRHLPLRRFRNAVLYAAVVAALIAFTALLRHRLTYGGAPVAPPIGIYLQAALLTDLLPFLAVIAVTQAVEAASRARQRELEAARMQGQLAEARLEALTAQLQPHFLFNTLQSISTLITHDAAAADRMLTSLSDLLREALRRDREVTLEEELRVLEPYLDISRARYGARLTVQLDVSDEARAAVVPFFVLQPLVENALHHGVGSRAGAGTVRISARRVDRTLLLAVSDDGDGTAPDTPRNGIGLGNTRARLEQLYGDAFTLTAAPAEPRGFAVHMAIPWRT